MPPRAAPTDYQAQAKAGTVTIAAEFMGHAVPTLDGTFNSEDYVVIETALFGAPDQRLKLSVEDFSLRINEPKKPLASQPYGMVLKTLKDPEWQPPTPPGGEQKSKTSFGSGGNDSGSTPAPVHMPIELLRAMQLKVQKSAMLEGDRALPQAGLIFFQYRGKTSNIHSLELVYSGPAGNATLTLQP